MTPQRFVEVFRIAALQAGRVATHLQGQVQVQQKPAEATPESAALTAVDLATQDVILHQLLAFAPHVAVDAEEDTDLVARFRGASSGAPLVVIDPVDGTLNYTRGSRDYAVMGALVVEGLFEAAIVLFPAYDVLYSAIRGAGCWIECAGSGPKPVSIDHPADLVLVSPGVPQLVQQRLSERFSEVSVSRCSAVDSSIVASGRAILAIAEGRSDRRRAIGYLLSAEAGGVIWHGDRPWKGEDPDLLASTLGPSITAHSTSAAGQVLELVRGATQEEARFKSNPVASE